MDALARLHHHHRHQPPCSSVDRYGPSLPKSISPFLSPPPIPPASPSIRASPSLSPSSSDLPLQNPQNPENLSFQFLAPLIKITSFATVTAASALLFVGFHGNGLINKPMQLSSMGSINESMEEEIEVEHVLAKDPFHVQSISESNLINLTQKIFFRPYNGYKLIFVQYQLTARNTILPLCILTNNLLTMNYCRS